MEEEKKKKRVVVESLGWLTESSIMPKRHRMIEGVGVSSILDLKAQLYKSQEESRKSKELAGPDVQFHRAKKIVVHDPSSVKNSGVDARAHKDKLELKAVNDGSVSYAALEKKAELYDKLVRGELSDEEDKEKYQVDFFRKGFEHNEVQHSIDRDTSASVSHENGDRDEDAKNDAPNFFDTNFTRPGRTSGEAGDSSDHRRFVREVHEEVNQAREKVSELKMQRQEIAAARREKLKQAYLRKLVEKAKASSDSKN